MHAYITRTMCTQNIITCHCLFGISFFGSFPLLLLLMNSYLHGSQIFWLIECTRTPYARLLIQAHTSLHLQLNKLFQLFLLEWKRRTKINFWLTISTKKNLEKNKMTMINSTKGKNYWNANERQRVTTKRYFAQSVTFLESDWLSVFVGAPIVCICDVLLLLLLRSAKCVQSSLNQIYFTIIFCRLAPQ